MFLNIICSYHKYPLTNRGKIVIISIVAKYEGEKKIEDRTEIHEMARRKINNGEIPSQH